MTAALALERPLTMPVPPPPPLQRMDEQLLAALPSAVGCARRFVRYTLERWRLQSLIDTAEVLVAELVGDAVAATGIVIEHPSYLDLYDKQLNLVGVQLQLIGTDVLVEVWDADPTPPWPREPAPERADTDSLHTVPRVEYRTYYLPPTGGKVVRVELEISPASSVENMDLALPRQAGFRRRQLFPSPARPVEMMADPVVLQRVVDGLRQLNTDGPSSGGPTAHTDIERKDS